MAISRLSNTADVTVSDRAVVGPQPDQTPATGGTTPTGGGGGGGGAITSVQGTANQVIVNGTTGSPQTGAIVLTLPQDIDASAAVQFSDLLATSSILASIAQAQRYNFPLVALSGSGTFTINVGNQNRSFINASGPVTLALSGISAGIQNVIIVRNNTGGAIAMAYPAWAVANGATLPSTLAAGAWLFLEIQPTGSTIGSVVVVYSASSTAPAIGTYLPTTGALHSRLRKAIPGTITSAGNMVWGRNTWFSWEDYGGVPNSSSPTDASNNVAAFAAAVSDAFTYAGPGGAACVFLPNGTWYADDQLAVTFPFNCSLAIQGTGRHGTQIVQLTAGKRGIYADLSAGTNKRNRTTVRGIGFKAASGVKLLDAVMVDYGAAAIVSSEKIGGSIVADIEIGNWSETDTGGWTWGATMKNAWHFHVSDIYGYGGLSWDGASSPGAGDGTGGGSGALLRFQSGVNYSASHIFGDFWSQFMRIEDAGLATPVDAQGVLCEHLNCVVCMEFVHAYAGPGGAGLLVGTFTNFECDNGNFNRAGYRGFVFEGNAGNTSLTTGYVYQDGGINILKLDSMTACTSTDVTFKNVDNNTSGPGVYATGTANVNKWNGCQPTPASGTFSIRFDASAGLSQMDNTGSATISNAGGGNIFLSTLF